MKTRRIFTALLAFIAVTLVWTCDEPAAEDILTHPDGWADGSSTLFHSVKVAESGFAFCASCHGEDYLGGTAGVGCSRSVCHTNFPHSEGFANSDTTGYHGDVLVTLDFALTSCEGCHGTDYLGGNTGQSCYTCHSVYPHPAAFMTEDSDDFHAIEVVTNGTSDCATCHGADFTGGDTGKSCFTCHADFPHADGWIAPASAAFHGKYLQGTSYDLDACSDCHGADFTGGIYAPGCRTIDCHTTYPHVDGWYGDANLHADNATTNGLQSCSGCHGADLTGGNTGKSCQWCHTMIPDWN